MAFSTRMRSSASESGRSAAVRLVRTAAMPQPMSTPTAAGHTASFMAMTEPTVAPLPKCTSGMTATWWNTHGSRAMLRSWSSADDSTDASSVQRRTSALPSPVRSAEMDMTGQTLRLACGASRVVRGMSA